MSLLTGLIGYWGFDEGAGNTALDLTGNGHDATFTGGGVPTSNQGWDSTHVKLGTSSLFTVNTSAPSGMVIPAINETLAATTFAGWLYSSISQNANYTGLFYSRASSGAPGFGVGYNLADQLGYQWSGSEFAWNSGIFLPTNRLCFVAFTVDSVGGTAYLGDNGTVSSATNSVAESPVNWNGVIGVGYDSNTTFRTFQGSMDGFGFWRRKLIYPEIAQLYNNGQGLPYPFGIRRMGRPLGSRIIMP